MPKQAKQIQANKTDWANTSINQRTNESIS